MSVFEHAIGAGMTWALYVIFVLDAKIIKNVKFKREILIYLTATLSFVCVFLTKMRGPILFLLIGILGVVNFRKKKFILFLLIAIAVLLIAFPYIVENVPVFTALFDSSAAASIGGSSLEQRVGQFTAGWQLVQGPHIFLGLGQKFQSVVVSRLVNRLFGLESIWLNDLVKFGVLGVVAEVWMMVYSLFVVPIYYKSREIFFVSLAYWAVSTVSSTPGFNIYLYYLVLFYFIKSSAKYKNETNKLIEKERSPWKLRYKFVFANLRRGRHI